MSLAAVAKRFAVQSLTPHMSALVDRLKEITPKAPAQGSPGSGLVWGKWADVMIKKELMQNMFGNAGRVMVN